MITLTCKGGCHTGPFPEESKMVLCTNCGVRRQIIWFDGPRAWDKWREWAMHPERSIITDGSEVRV